MNKSFQFFLLIFVPSHLSSLSFLWDIHKCLVYKRPVFSAFYQSYATISIVFPTSLAFLLFLFLLGFLLFSFRFCFISSHGYSPSWFSKLAGSSFISIISPFSSVLKRKAVFSSPVASNILLFTTISLKGFILTRVIVA